MILLILNFEFRFGQKVKVKLGSPFDGAKIVNLPVVVVDIRFCSCCKIVFNLENKNIFLNVLNKMA